MNIKTRQGADMKSLVLHRSSSIALLMSLAGGAVPAWGQQATQNVPGPQADTQGGLTEIVVTGSFIRGTPVDTALPVEVYSQEELERRGSPTALEFAKTLTIAGPTTGESYYFGGPTLIGSVNYNLRGLGSDKTLILLNGRRMDINTANIPSLALARTEILKDGAAVIYGADAIGGVVNFITRDRFVGIDLSGQYKYIDGSDGDYSAGILVRGCMRWSAISHGIRSIPPAPATTPHPGRLSPTSQGGCRAARCRAYPAQQLMVNSVCPSPASFRISRRNHAQQSAAGTTTTSPAPTTTFPITTWSKTTTSIAATRSSTRKSPIAWTFTPMRPTRV
jgi:hypothetical protein